MLYDMLLYICMTNMYVMLYIILLYLVVGLCLFSLGYIISLYSSVNLPGMYSYNSKPRYILPNKTNINFLIFKIFHIPGWYVFIYWMQN